MGFIQVLVAVTLVAAVSCTGDVCIATKCKSPEYHLNPYTSTCIRQIKQSKNYNDAKAYCKSQGEELAVFDTLESLNFMKHLRKTVAEFAYAKEGRFLFAGKKVNNVWRHDGRIDAPITNMDWEQNQPDGNGECLQMRGQAQNYGVDDLPCTVQRNFLCETKAVPVDQI